MFIDGFKQRHGGGGSSMNVMSDYMDDAMESPKKKETDSMSATTFETKVSKCPFAHL